jgi:major vault protein
MTDIVVVETLDHARLQLQLSYNWEFDRTNIDKRAFSVPDFVGDACKAIASRIRGVVAGETFDAFHKHSATIIRRAVFGDRNGLDFPANGLLVTNVDIHSVDPVDPKTREALTKSVQLAIEITTKSQEAAALQQATSLEQEAKGKLERQIIEDKSLSEKERTKLLEVEANNAAVESTGASKAQASAQAASTRIEGENEVTLAEMRCKAQRIMFDAELEIEQMKHDVEIAHRKELYRLQVARVRGLANIEADKFGKVIQAVGKETIKALARAGPELQSRLLKSLGLQGYLVTDGSNPINLFNAAKGLTATPTTGSTMPRV